MNDSLITGPVDEESMKKEQVSVTRVQSHENDFRRVAKSRSSSAKEATETGEAQKMNQRLAPDFLSVSKMAHHVICDAQKKGMVAVIAFLASCDTLYPMIQEAIQAQIVIFVIDDRFCIKVPIKSPFLFVDKTFLSDVTQAITDVVSHNGMKDIIIIYEDNEEDNSVVTWNERIKIDNLIQKLSTNLIRTTLFKISPHFKKLLSSPSSSSPTAITRTSFPYISRYDQNNNNMENKDRENREDHQRQQQPDREASLNMLIDLMAHKIEAFNTGIGDWRSTGITLVALTERSVLDSLIHLLIQEGKFPLSATIFHVDNVWKPPRLEENLDPNSQPDSDHQLKQQPSKYWFDQEQMILKRRYHSKLVKIYEDLTINHAPKNRHFIGPKESFIICAIESISDAAHYIVNEKVEQVKSLSACDLNQDRHPSAGAGLSPTHLTDESNKNNNENGNRPPEMFAEAIHVRTETQSSLNRYFLPLLLYY